MENVLKQMMTKDIKILKEKIWLQNNKRCPLLEIEVELDKMVLDHAHKLKTEEADINKGTIRNALEFRANAMEGKITNNWKRYFGADETKHPITLSNYLRNLADYLEQDSYCETLDDEHTYFIHPSEKPKTQYIKKTCYNKLIKAVDDKVKIPVFNDKGKQKLTKAFEKLFEKYDVEIEFYK